MVARTGAKAWQCEQVVNINAIATTLPLYELSSSCLPSCILKTNSGALRGTGAVWSGAVAATITPVNASSKLAAKIFILYSVSGVLNFCEIASPVTGENLLQHIQHLPHQRGTFRQLLRETHLDRETLQARLDELLQRGEIIETRSDHFAVIAGSREY